jgi:signal transduction histidine kinase
MAFELRPQGLDEFGLVAALRGLGSGLAERGGPRVELTVDFPAGDRLPPRVETALFRVTQEALTNVVKHAGANVVSLNLGQSERSVVLVVHYDGCGFSEEQGADGRFGLVGMRERIASVNGALAIESERGAGARITVEIPVA